MYSTFLAQYVPCTVRSLYNTPYNTSHPTGSLYMYIYVTDLTALMTSPCLHISLAGTIPSTFSKLTSLSLLYLFSNYLTMGSATTVPNTTFSSTTLSGGGLSLGSNCLAFHYGSISVSATHCAPTSGKSVILFEYVCALPMTTAQCFIMYCMDVDVTHI